MYGNFSRYGFFSLFSVNRINRMYISTFCVPVNKLPGWGGLNPMDTPLKHDFGIGMDLEQLLSTQRLNNLSRPRGRQSGSENIRRLLPTVIGNNSFQNFHIFFFNSSFEIFTLLCFRLDSRLFLLLQSQL